MRVKEMLKGTSFKLPRFLFFTAIVIFAAVVDLSAKAAHQDWTVLQNCRLILNPANDGDSFHVRVGNRDCVFRLHLVDAPETGVTDPKRLIDQANYFGITVPNAIEVGEAATKFTRQRLGRPFKVFTRWSGAGGRTDRFYAFVQTREGDLGEQLVRNGLARIYGIKVVAPGSSSYSERLEKLHRLEDQACKRRIGAWGLGKLDINTATEKELRTVPGIGPAIVAGIVAARPFKSANDLKKVPGIGRKRYAQFRPYFKD